MKERILQALKKGALEGGKAFAIAFLAAIGISQISPDAFAALLKLLERL